MITLVTINAKRLKVRWYTKRKTALWFVLYEHKFYFMTFTLGMRGA